MALAFALGLVQAQIKFTPMYPGVKFKRPVYMGPFPGRPDANVVLEAHTGLALVVYPKGSGWAQDTLLHLEVNQANDMGLLGIAFHPAFAANHKYYVSYDSPDPKYDIVEERQVDSSGRRDAGKGRILLKLADKYDNHNGGTLAFGPKDGFLYFAMGDGGGAYDPDSNGQNPNTLFGKMIRIDVDRKDAGLEYGIPPDNPFAKGGGRAEVFAIGLRSPWKWAFDPVNGDLWLADVGESLFEEVDLIAKGGNYGWAAMEGPQTGPKPAGIGPLVPPVYSYGHSVGQCIIGGEVFRGLPGGRYDGAFFITDLFTRKLWALRKAANGTVTAEALPDAPTNAAAFGKDAQGRLYLAGLDEGAIYRMEGPDLTPAPTAMPPAAGRRSRIFPVTPGGRLGAEAFGSAREMSVISLRGERLGAIRRDGVVPPGLAPGMYILQAPRAPAAAERGGWLWVR